MRISPAAEFAVRGALVLAEHYGNGPTTLNSICEEQDISKQYLVKIFASLARAGLVRPVRGKLGGYLLAREPAQISILDLMEAVEGPIAVNFCQHDPPRCDRSDGVRRSRG
nr:Rrf2 family transcriptional regulator [Planctomycetota bacterium]